MTLTTPYSATFYVGDEETKTFPYLFEEVSESFISVIVYNSLTGQSSTPTYIVDTDQKQVIFGDDTPAPTADETVCIYRNTPNVQDTPFRTLQGYDAKALENILSKIVAMIQEIKSNYFTTQVLQGDPWQLDLLTSADDGATVNIDYVAKKLVKGLYFQITNGNLQVSADGSSYITMPKSADIVEFRQVQTVLEDLTVQYRLQYRIGNEWFNAESNAEATADEAKQIAEEARDIASDAKDIAQDAKDIADSFDDRLTQAEQDASDAKDIAQDASDAVSAHITDTNNPHSVTKAQIGLGNCDNTADLDKPISTATQTALDTKATPADITSAISTHNADSSAHSSIISPIQEVIPTAATSSNQLADKNFVNSSIATSTATFRGTYNSLAELEAQTADENDYGFVVSTDAAGNTIYNRYKYTTATTPASWVFEYALNNSSFTATQWDAINSGANTTNIGQIATNTSAISSHTGNTSNPHSVTKAQVGLGNVDNTSDADKPISTATQSALDGKQATISDLSTIRSNAQAGKAASDTIATYGDIVTHDVSEFATAAQGTKADSALQTGDNVSELVNDAGYLTQHQTLADLGITATASEINVLDGITANTTELNYTDGVTSNIQTQLNSKQATISDLSTIRSNAQAGKSASDTIATYGDIVTHDVSEFATAAQGAKADTAVQPSDLATVATTGSYNDLSDKPTIGNATLTIQKNSTTIDTFTANATSNKTIDIAVPTKTSDMTNDSDYQNGTQVATAISTHNTSATAHSNQFNAITDKIPAEASSSNKLADKAFVNSSIATNTANFIGTFNSVAELEAYSGTVTNNDYAFVIVTDSAGNTAYDRYKYTTATTPASWVFEYELNNSSFTAAQWAAINSGANTTNIGQIATNTTTISNHIGNTSNPHQVTKAQVGLGNVDNTSDLAKPISTATQTALNAKANIADLATVATSGSYNDLSDKPTIPTVNNATLTIQKNGTTVQTFTANQSTNATANISVPTKTSDITNDSGFITSSALAPYALSADLASVATSGSYNDLTNKPTIPADISAHRVNGASLSNSASVFYGTSDTAAATVEKVVSIPSITTLDVGTVIVVQPTVTSTVANSTIKLNNFSAYPMRYNNAAITTSTDSIVWNAAYPSVWVFDGTYWCFVAHGIDSNTTYSTMSVAEGTTGTATSNRVLQAVNLKQIIQGTTLTGIDVATTGAVSASDTITDGIGKLQATKADKSELPTVGNGTITITQGGISKGTFTTNQSGNTTIALDAGGGGIGNIDNLTITANASNEIQAVATVNANTAAGAINPIYDWVGTLAEYTAQNVATTHPDWLCYITDDNTAQAFDAYNKTESDARYVQQGHQVIDFQEPTAANYYTWYRKYADGWVEQGGFSSGEPRTATLAVAMADTNYSVICIQRDTTAPTMAEGSPRAGAISTTQIYVNGGSTPNNVCWQVSGMAA